MSSNNLLKIFKKESAALNGWLSIPNSFTAEAMSKMGWDSLTIDMQHGLNDYSSSISMLQALSSSKIVPIVRVPWNEPGIIMKSLDLGAMGIIAPMINNKKECEDFVSYCNYPPLGKRSFGPMRAQLIYGSDYFEEANKNIISMAMIETKEAVENLDFLLKNSIRERLIADVPVGVFLSGGIDSSMIAIAASQIDPHIKAFTVRIPYNTFDETHYAKEIAKLNDIRHEIIDFSGYEKGKEILKLYNIEI